MPGFLGFIVSQGFWILTTVARDLEVASIVLIVTVFNYSYMLPFFHQLKAAYSGFLGHLQS